MPAFENDMTHSQHSDGAMADEVDQRDNEPAPALIESEDGDTDDHEHLTLPTGPSDPQER